MNFFDFSQDMAFVPAGTAAKKKSGFFGWNPLDLNPEWDFADNVPQDVPADNPYPDSQWTPPAPEVPPFDPNLPDTYVPPPTDTYQPDTSAVNPWGTPPTPPTDPWLPDFSQQQGPLDPSLEPNDPAQWGYQPPLQVTPQPADWSIPAGPLNPAWQQSDARQWGSQYTDSMQQPANNWMDQAPATPPTDYGADPNFNFQSDNSKLGPFTPTVPSWTQGVQGPINPDAPLTPWDQGFRPMQYSDLTPSTQAQVSPQPTESISPISGVDFPDYQSKPRGLLGNLGHTLFSPLDAGGDLFSGNPKAALGDLGSGAMSGLTAAGQAFGHGLDPSLALGGVLSGDAYQEATGKNPWESPGSWLDAAKYGLTHPGESRDITNQRQAAKIADLVPGTAFDPYAVTAVDTLANPLAWIGPGAAGTLGESLGLGGNALGKAGLGLLDQGGIGVSLGGNLGGQAAQDIAQRNGITDPRALALLGLGGGLLGGIGGGLTAAHAPGIAQAALNDAWLPENLRASGEQGGGDFRSNADLDPITRQILGLDEPTAASSGMREIAPAAAPGASLQDMPPAEFNAAYEKAGLRLDKAEERLYQAQQNLRMDYEGSPSYEESAGFVAQREQARDLLRGDFDRFDLELERRSKLQPDPRARLEAAVTQSPADTAKAVQMVREPALQLEIKAAMADAGVSHPAEAAALLVETSPEGQDFRAKLKAIFGGPDGIAAKLNDEQGSVDPNILGAIQKGVKPKTPFAERTAGPLLNLTPLAELDARANGAASVGDILTQADHDYKTALSLGNQLHEVSATEFRGLDSYKGPDKNTYLKGVDPSSWEVAYFTQAGKPVPKDALLVRVMEYPDQYKLSPVQRTAVDNLRDKIITPVKDERDLRGATVPLTDLNTAENQQYFARLAQEGSDPRRAVGGEVFGNPRTGGTNLARPNDKTRLYQDPAEAVANGVVYAHPAEAVDAYVGKGLKAAIDAHVRESLRPFEISDELAPGSTVPRAAENATALQGVRFSPQDAQQIAEFYRRATPGPPVTMGEKAISLVRKANSFMTPVRATLDHSATLGQLLITAPNHPIQFAKNFAKSIPDAFMDGPYQKWAASDYVQEAAQSGVNVLGRAQQTSEFQFHGALAKVPGVKQAENAYERIINRNRVDTFHAIVDWNEAHRTPMDAYSREQVARSVNRLTGSGSGTPNGLRSLTEFAPGYLSANIQNVTKALTDGGIEGQLARRYLGVFAGTGTALITGVALQQGRDPQEVLSPLDLNALKAGELKFNPNFGTMRLGGNDYQVYGQYGPLMRLVVLGASTGQQMAKQGDPRDEGASYLNPIAKMIGQYYQQKGGPVANLGATIAMKASGADTYSPDPLSLRGALNNAAPITIGQFITDTMNAKTDEERQNAIYNGIASFFGARVSPLTDREKAVQTLGEVVNPLTGVQSEATNWNALNLLTKKQLRETNPALVAPADTQRLQGIKEDSDNISKTWDDFSSPTSGMTVGALRSKLGVLQPHLGGLYDAEANSSDRGALPVEDQWYLKLNDLYKASEVDGVVDYDVFDAKEAQFWKDAAASKEIGPDRVNALRQYIADMKGEGKSPVQQQRTAAMNTLSDLGFFDIYKYQHYSDLPPGQLSALNHEVDHARSLDPKLKAMSVHDATYAVLHDRYDGKVMADVYNYGDPDKRTPEYRFFLDNYRDLISWFDNANTYRQVQDFYTAEPARDAALKKAFAGKDWYAATPEDAKRILAGISATSHNGKVK